MSPQELLEMQRRRSVQMCRLLYDGPADVPSIPPGYGSVTVPYYSAQYARRDLGVTEQAAADAAFLRSLGIAP